MRDGARAQLRAVLAHGRVKQPTLQLLGFLGFAPCTAAPARLQVHVRNGARAQLRAVLAHGRVKQPSPQVLGFLGFAPCPAAPARLQVHVRDGARAQLRAVLAHGRVKQPTLQVLGFLGFAPCPAAPARLQVHMHDGVRAELRAVLAHGRVKRLQRALLRGLGHRAHRIHLRPCRGFTGCALDIAFGQWHDNEESEPTSRSLAAVSDQAPCVACGDPIRTLAFCTSKPAFLSLQKRDAWPEAQEPGVDLTLQAGVAPACFRPALDATMPGTSSASFIMIWAGAQQLFVDRANNVQTYPVSRWAAGQRCVMTRGTVRSKNPLNG